MKKIFFIAVLALGLTANSQEIKFGAKAGVNFASLNGDGAKTEGPTGNMIELDGKTSFHVGVFAEIGISDKFSVQPELLYSGQGASKDFSLGNLKSTINLNYGYLNLPIIAKYYVIENLSLQAGPQIGYLLSASLDTKVTVDGKEKAKGESSEDLNKKFKEKFDDFDFGLAFGAGYKLDNGLNFDARYILGLTDIVNTEKLGISSDAKTPKTKNGIIQISVGYSF